LAEQRLPSEIIEATKRKLKDILDRVSGAPEQVGQVYQVISAGEPLWRNIDKRIEDVPQDPILASGYSFIISLSKQVDALDEHSKNFSIILNNVVSNTSIYADATAATGSASGIVFDPSPLQRELYQFKNHEDYAKKLGELDHSLGESFRGIKANYYTRGPDHMRTTLFEARQVFDHFFEKLVPDDSEVIKQPWWSPCDSDKPNSVSREQRLRYAAEKYVKDQNQRQVLIDASRHTIEVYKKLQQLHARGSLDETKAKDAVLEMVSIIRSWCDSMAE